MPPVQALIVAVRSSPRLQTCSQDALCTVLTGVLRREQVSD